MKINEFCKKNKISKSSLFKYLSGESINNITKKKLNNLNISKELFDDYDKQYQKWYIQYYGKKQFYDISKKSHISIPSWTKYYMHWKLNKQIAKRIEKYIKEHRIDIDSDVVIDEEESQYKGENFLIYSWNIDDNKRRIQIEIKERPLMKNINKLLKLLNQFDYHLFARIIQGDNKFGIIIDIDKSINEKEIVNIIDKQYDLIKI